MNDYGRKYAEFAKESFSWRYIERPALERVLPGDAYSDETEVLDIGCSAGRVVDFHLRTSCRESNVTGIDPDETTIEMAKENFPEATFINKRIQDVDLADRTYDIVTAQLSLRYLDNSELAQVLGSVASSLKPNGIFVMLDTHPARHALTDGFERYSEEGVRTAATPWGGSESFYYRTISTYINSIIEASLSIGRFDECPIESEAKEDYPDEYKRYNRSPARFMIMARKSN
ncbi:MAG: class I SAM-dependent methyltransferase [Candidatus Saccharibacteria bacterium]|nr:class I SAM-dependent methyltransferase [Candidatus Saccharibacteria bacterium]